MRICRRPLAAFAAAAAALSGSPVGAQDPAALWRSSIDTLDAVGTVVAVDREVAGREGDAAIRITTDWPTMINLGTVDDVDIEAATLVYRASVRCAGLRGGAFLEMWVHLPDGGQYFSRGLEDTCHGDMEWTTLSAPFVLLAGQNPDRVTLNIAIDGTGTVWVDDLQLSVQTAD